MLPGGAASAACLLFSLAIAQDVAAQSTWSPEPFAAKQSIAPLQNFTARTSPASSQSTNSFRNRDEQSQLNNRLRDSFANSTATNAQDRQVVVRWKSVEQSKLPVEGYSDQTYAAQPSSPIRSQTAQAAFTTPNPTTAANAIRNPMRTTRSSQEIAQERQQQAQRAPQPEASQNRAPVGPASWTSRSDAQYENPVRQVAYQDSHESLPPVPNFQMPAPGATADPSGTLDSTEPRSLLIPSDEEDAAPPSPFREPSRQLDLEELRESPSDQNATDEDDAPERPNGNQPPVPPKGEPRMLNDCDAIRTQLLETPITNIRLDVSPSFGTGPKDKQSAQERREKFATQAPIRGWTDFKGRPITDGRLIDLRYDAVELELADGSRQGVFLRDLSDSDLAYVSEVWGLPMTCGVSADDAPVRSYVPATVTWQASGLCHKPLYFQDTQLERYGHEFGPIAQPLISSAHFFGNVAFLPYKMGINPPSECQYALGYYRPGNCAPWTIAPVPLSLRGALMQSTAVTGAAMVLP